MELEPTLKRFSLWIIFQPRQLTALSHDQNSTRLKVLGSGNNLQLEAKIDCTEAASAGSKNVRYVERELESFSIHFLHEIPNLYCSRGCSHLMSAHRSYQVEVLLISRLIDITVQSPL